MRRRQRFASVFILLVCAYVWTGVSKADDWIVLETGARTRVQGLKIGERAVEILTLHGVSSAVIRRAVDVPATRAANGMMSDQRESPGWPQLSPPIEKVGELKQKPGSPLPPINTPPVSPAPVETVQPERSSVVRETTSIPEPSEPPPEVTADSHSDPDRVHETSEPSRIDPPSTLPPTTSTGGGSVSSTVLVGDAGRPVPRLVLFFNGARPTSPLSFVERREFELFREQASIEASYEDPIRPGIELGAWLRIAGPLSVGASMELYDNRRSAAYRALLPHPFFFEQFRELSGELDLSHREQALHVDAVLSKQFGHHFSMDFFAGPSLLFARTDVIVDVLFDEVYPYQSVVDRGARVESFTARPLGFNVGASASYRIYRNIGIDFGFRFSRARVVIETPNATPIEFDGGGLRAGAGLRLLFP